MESELIDSWGQAGLFKTNSLQTMLSFACHKCYRLICRYKARRCDNCDMASSLSTISPNEETMYYGVNDGSAVSSVSVYIDSVDVSLCAAPVGTVTPFIFRAVLDSCPPTIRPFHLPASPISLRVLIFCSTNFWRLRKTNKNIRKIALRRFLPGFVRAADFNPELSAPPEINHPSHFNTSFFLTLPAKRKSPRSVS